MYRFPKSERLKGQKQIEKLFLEGESMYKYPIRVVYRQLKFSNAFEHDGYPIKVAFSVPKRKIKKAVERNRVKRRMREAYRLNRKTVLDLETLSSKQLQLQLVFIYQHHAMVDYQIVEKAVVKLLKKMEVV